MPGCRAVTAQRPAGIARQGNSVFTGRERELAENVTIPALAGCVTAAVENLDALPDSAVPGPGSDAETTAGELCTAGHIPGRDALPVMNCRQPPGPVLRALSGRVLRRDASARTHSAAWRSCCEGGPPEPHSRHVRSAAGSAASDSPQRVGRLDSPRQGGGRGLLHGHEVPGVSPLQGLAGLCAQRHDLDVVLALELRLGVVPRVQGSQRRGAAMSRPQPGKADPAPRTGGRPARPAASWRSLAVPAGRGRVATVRRQQGGLAGHQLGRPALGRRAAHTAP